MSLICALMEIIWTTTADFQGSGSIACETIATLVVRLNCQSKIGLRTFLFNGFLLAAISLIDSLKLETYSAASFGNQIDLDYRLRYRREGSHAPYVNASAYKGVYLRFF